MRLGEPRCSLALRGGHLQIPKQAEGEGQGEESTKALDLTNLLSVLARADEIIE